MSLGYGVLPVEQQGVSNLMLKKKKGGGEWKNHN